MDYQSIILAVIFIVGALTLVVNLVTEVVKLVFVKFASAEAVNFFVMILSVALTVAVFIAYWQFKSMAITWYIILAFIIVGFFVAYAAMFGYDKWLSAFEKYFKK